MTTLRIFGIPVHVDHERHETFAVSGAVHIEVATKSGDITIKTSDTKVITVHVTTKGVNNEWMVEDADISFESESGKLVVRSPFDVGSLFGASGVNWHFGITKGYAGRGRKWFQAGRGDVSVWVEVPVGSSVQTRTASGKTRIDGAAGAVDSASVSGSLTLPDPVGPVQFKTVSGDLVAPQVSGPVSVQSVSGGTTLGVCGPENVRIQTVSGSSTIAVQPGIAVDVDAFSLSGRVSSEIDLHQVPVESSTESAKLSVRAVSGAISITRR